jgi:hypothetical protein
VLGAAVAVSYHSEVCHHCTTTQLVWCIQCLYCTWGCDDSYSCAVALNFSFIMSHQQGARECGWGEGEGAAGAGGSKSDQVWGSGRRASTWDGQSARQWHLACDISCCKVVVSVWLVDLCILTIMSCLGLKLHILLCKVYWLELLIFLNGG